MTWAPQAPQQQQAVHTTVVPAWTSLQQGPAVKHNMVYNDKQLTAAIKNASNVERLAQLMHCPLNPIHIATMFVKLINTSKALSQGSTSAGSAGVMCRERMQSLQVQQQLTAHLQQVLLATQCAGHCCRGLANIIWALGKLQPKPEVLNMLLQKFFSQLSSSVPQDIANVLWGVAQITRNRSLAPDFFSTAALNLPTQTQQELTTAQLSNAQPESISTSAVCSSGSNVSVAADPGLASSSHSALQPPATRVSPPSPAVEGADHGGKSTLQQHALLSMEQVQQLLQRLVDTVQQAAPQTISNITCALCVLQHCHQWCMCSCLPQLKEILMAFGNTINDALPSHVQKVVRCLAQLSLACSTHAREVWISWQPPLLQSMLTHLLLQRKTLKQFHITSVLRDVTQLSCLFLPVEAAAELAGVAAPADKQQQDQLVLMAAAVAAAAIDEALELYGAYSTDDFDGEDFQFPTARLLTNSNSSLDGGVVRSASDGAASSAAPGSCSDLQQPQSPVSALVHHLVAGMFRRLVLEDLTASIQDGSHSSSLQVAAAELLLSNAHQLQGSVDLQAGSPAALVLLSPDLPAASAAAGGSAGATPGVRGGSPTLTPTGRPPSTAVLEKLMAQLDQLGVLQQYSTLRALCSQMGPAGLTVSAGPSATAALMQPGDRALSNSRHAGMHSSRTGSQVTFQQHQQLYGGEPQQQQRWWDNNRADQQQQQQQRLPVRAGHSGYSLPQAFGESVVQHGRPLALSGDRGAAADSPGVASGAVGRVYVQQQAQHQQQQMLAGNQQYQQLQQKQQTPEVETGQYDTVMTSPFMRTASLACGMAPTAAVPGPPGLNSPLSSTVTAGLGGLRLVPSNSSGWMSSPANSGAVTSVFGGSGSYLSQGSVLPCLSGTSFGVGGTLDSSAMGSSAMGSTTTTELELALAASVTGHTAARLSSSALLSHASVPTARAVAGEQLQQSSSATGLHAQQGQQQSGSGNSGFVGNVSMSGSFEFSRNNTSMRQLQPPAASTAAVGLLQPPPGLPGLQPVPAPHQQQAEEPSIVIIQQNGQTAAYRKMPDATLVPVPVQQHSQPQMAAGMMVVQQQAHQQPAMLVGVSGLGPEVNAAGQHAMDPGQQQQLQLQYSVGGAACAAVGAETAASSGHVQLQQQQQQQQALQQSMSAGAEAGTQVYFSQGGSQQNAGLQGSFTPTGTAATNLMGSGGGGLATNQLMMQQQLQLQQHAAQQQYVQLPDGQLIQVSGGYIQTSTDLRQPVSSAFAPAAVSNQSATTYLNLGNGVVMGSDSAHHLLTAMPGSQQQLGVQQQQQLGQQQQQQQFGQQQQQQQLFFVMPHNSGY